MEVKLKGMGCGTDEDASPLTTLEGGERYPEPIDPAKEVEFETIGYKPDEDVVKPPLMRLEGEGMTLEPVGPAKDVKFDKVGYGATEEVAVPPLTRADDSKYPDPVKPA